MTPAVCVGVVLDGEDVDAMIRVVDPVDDSVVTTVGAVQTFELELRAVPTRCGFADSEP